MKKCSVCNLILPFTSFHKHSHTKDKLRYDCKNCRNKENKIYRNTHPEVILKYKTTHKNQKQAYDLKRWKDKKHILGPINRKNRIGVTPEQYDQQFIKQSGRCAICNKPAAEFIKGLAADHDHNTQLFRGLLCGRCNCGLGMFQDNEDLLIKAIEYLKIKGVVKC